jgi:hypothetical protein
MADLRCVICILPHHFLWHIRVLISGRAEQYVMCFETDLYFL